MPHRADAGRVFVACGALALSLVSVSACGMESGTGMSAAGSSASPMAGGPTPSPSASGAGGSAADCTRATKTAITEKVSGSGDTYAFSPAKLTITRGAFLAITNGSDEAHTLTATPDAGIVTSVVDKKERQVIQFPRAGTFTVQSADARHRAVLRLTVAGESGCGTPKPTLTIAGSATAYAFSPNAVTVNATENVTVVNRSDTAHTIRCTPDPGGNGDNSTVDAGETQILAFDKPGTFTCASTQHAGTKITITVAGK